MNARSAPPPDVQNPSHDVIILGAGLIGLTQALALGVHGLRCALIDHTDMEKMLSGEGDLRASAINSSSWHMFEALNIAEKLTPFAGDIAQIIVNDGLKPGRLDFVPEPHSGPIGKMVDNMVLRRTLWAAVKQHENIDIHVPASVLKQEHGVYRVNLSLKNKSSLSAPVVIAADGRRSASRETAGIAMARWQYDNHAISGTIAHALPHEQRAYEIFYAEGPIAILPLPDDAQGRHRSSIVWTVSTKNGPLLAQLSDRAFAAEVEKKMGGFLGDVSCLSERQSYPLGFHQAATLTSARLALVGDAGHAIHPIAGQGLNLGLRDVAALTEILVGGARTGMDLGDAQLLARYDRWRGLDVRMVSAATDILTRLYGLPGETSSALRRAGMGLVQRAKPLKKTIMAEARGESGTLPQLLMGERI